MIKINSYVIFSGVLILLAQGLQFCASLLYANNLSTDDYHSYILLFALTPIIEKIADLGGRTLFLSEYTHEGKLDLSTYLSSRIFLFPIVSVIVCYIYDSYSLVVLILIVSISFTQNDIDPTVWIIRLSQRQYLEGLFLIAQKSLFIAPIIFYQFYTNYSLLLVSFVVFLFGNLIRPCVLLRYIRCKLKRNILFRFKVNDIRRVRQHIGHMSMLLMLAYSTRFPFFLSDEFSSVDISLTLGTALMLTLPMCVFSNVYLMSNYREMKENFISANKFFEKNIVIFLLKYSVFVLPLIIPIYLVSIITTIFFPKYAGLDEVVLASYFFILLYCFMFVLMQFYIVHNMCIKFAIFVFMSTVIGYLAFMAISVIYVMANSSITILIYSCMVQFFCIALLVYFANSKLHEVHSAKC